METFKEVYDPETGVTFTYTWGTFGWYLRLGEWFDDTPESDKLMKRGQMLWPEVPEEMKEKIKLEMERLSSILPTKPWPLKKGGL